MSDYDVRESQGTVKDPNRSADVPKVPLRFHPVPVGKTVTIRGCDAQGGGLPGAARTRNGVHVAGAHLGSVDICGIFRTFGAGWRRKT
jgi:hypothetical protein